MVWYKKVLISFFILFNFLTMIRVHVPLKTPYFKTLYKPIDPYLSFFSIYQDWMMFSPNPTRMDSYLSAVIHFTDGTKTTYAFPRPSDMKFIDKYTYGEKFRKIITESIRRDDHNFMWNDTARFAIRQVMEANNFSKMPLKVKLIRHWDDVPHISQKFRLHGPPIVAYKTHEFFSYGVNQ